MKYLLLLIFVLLINLKTAVAQKLGQGIVLYTMQGDKVKLSEAVGNRATAIVFLSPECPLCQSYSLTLNKLWDEYSGKGIALIGVFPGSIYTAEEISSFSKSYKIKFALLKDPEKSLATSVGAAITPEVFLYDSNLQLIYSGRIDDWAYSVGKKKPKPTQHDLKTAIGSYLSNKPISNKRTQPVGCIIE